MHYMCECCQTSVPVEQDMLTLKATIKVASTSRDSEYIYLEHICRRCITLMLGAIGRKLGQRRPTPITNHRHRAREDYKPTVDLTIS